jgi:hypothetical protein
VATTTAAAVTTEKNDYLGCFLYASNNAVQVSYSQSSLHDTFNQPTSSSSSLGAAVGEEVAKKTKKKYYHRISPTAMNDVWTEQNANVVVDEVSTTATVAAKKDGVQLISQQQQQQQPPPETKHRFENFAKAAIQQVLSKPEFISAMNNAWGSCASDYYNDSIITNKRSMLENTLLQRCKLAVIHNGMSIQQFTQRLEVVLRKEILGDVGSSSSRRGEDVSFEKETFSSISYNNTNDYNDDTNTLYYNMDKVSMTSNHNNSSNTNENKSSLSSYNTTFYNNDTNKLYYDFHDKGSMTNNVNNNSSNNNESYEMPQQYKLLLHDSRLVTQNEYGLVPDYMFLAYAQLISCKIDETDKVGPYSERPSGFVGLCCRHCCYDDKNNVGSWHGGRYFPDSIRSLAQTTATKTVVKHITSKCHYVPDNIKVRSIQCSQKIYTTPFLYKLII